MREFIAEKFGALGYGHKARALYISVIVLAALFVLFGLRFGAPEAFYFWTLGIGGAALLLIYSTMAGVERVAESGPIRKAFKHGQGGSARWGGSGTFAKYEWRGGNAPIFLGRSLGKYDPRPRGREIGVDDENHLVTIGQSGSGKSTTVIWPNLVKHPYPDSVFVLDPKGEHAQNTAMHRKNLGQKVVVLDPMQETHGLKRSGFNPLAELDLSDIAIKENILLIVRACVIDKGGDTSTHFNEIFQSLFAGLIVQVLTTEPKKNHHLPRVYDLFKTLGTDEGEEVLETMRSNHACGNLASDGAQMLQAAGKNERGSIITTCLRNINWIASEGMREHLLDSGDFRLSDLRSDRPLSLYVVLPFDNMHHSVQGRYMRVLITLAFKACREHSMLLKRKHRRTLFILDEVSMLGDMPELENAYKTLRGYKVKIWTFYQQYSGLSDQVEDTAAITGNSTKQFFGVNDPVTAAQIEKYLGQYRYQDQTREIQRSLLDETEILDTLGQSDMVQIVITGEGDKMELARERFIPEQVDGPDYAAIDAEVPRSKYHTLSDVQSEAFHLTHGHHLDYLKARNALLETIEDGFKFTRRESDEWTLNKKIEELDRRGLGVEEATEEQRQWMRAVQVFAFPELDDPVLDDVELVGYRAKLEHLSACFARNDVYEKMWLDFNEYCTNGEASAWAQVKPHPLPEFLQPVSVEPEPVAQPEAVPADPIIAVLDDDEKSEPVEEIAMRWKLSQPFSAADVEDRAQMLLEFAADDKIEQITEEAAQLLEIARA